MNPPLRSDCERYLTTLQRLLEIPATDVRSALTHAADALADVVRADKVDAFVFDPSRDSLVASQRRDFFSSLDATLVASAARWIGSVAERAGLVETIERAAVEQGRRSTAEEVVTVLAHDIRNDLQPLVWRLHTLGRRAAAEGRDDDIAADPVRLRQCIDNVLLNALAHSPRNAPVHVVVTREDAADGPFARLEIVPALP